MTEIVEIIGWKKNRVYSHLDTFKPVPRTTIYITREALSLQDKRTFYNEVQIQNEVFKEIEGSDGTYFISNKGRCRHVDGHLLLPLYRLKEGKVEAAQVYVKFLHVTKKHKLADIVAHHFIRPKKDGEITSFRNKLRIQCFLSNIYYTTKGKVVGNNNKNRFLVQQICPVKKEVINEFTKKDELLKELRISDWHYKRCIADPNFDSRFQLRIIKETPTFYV